MPGVRGSTCLAFAASVFKGARQISECPRLDPEIVSHYSDGVETPRTLEQDGEEALRQMQEKIAQVDLAEAAARLGGRYNNDKLTLRILGKEFSIDSRGQFTTDIHVHGWINRSGCYRPIFWPEGEKRRRAIGSRCGS